MSRIILPVGKIILDLVTARSVKVVYQVVNISLQKQQHQKTCLWLQSDF